MDIGSRLKELREARGLTLEQVGSYVGVNKATVQRYEIGNIDIKRNVAIKLAECLGTSPSYIMGWTDNPYVAEITEYDAPLLSKSSPKANIIKIAGRDGSYTEKRVSDEQLALFQSMLDQMKPVDDESI